jgi:SAM-dependent methyltransferase
LSCLLNRASTLDVCTVVRQDVRTPFTTALQGARQAAFPAGQYVGQESFMTADEIRTLARRCEVGPATSVLDLCCGVAGPGRLIAAERGCTYTGVDYSASALEVARALAAGLRCRFVEAHVPPVPEGRYDVVLLLEAMLAFADKATLLREVAQAVVPGGLFACTVEAGEPLTSGELVLMPDPDTVHLVGLPQLTDLLAASGFSVVWTRECTSAHQVIAARLRAAFRDRRAELVPQIGEQGIGDLLAAHQLWSDWLRSGRVRKYAVVARRQ